MRKQIPAVTGGERTCPHVQKTEVTGGSDYAADSGRPSAAAAACSNSRENRTECCADSRNGKDDRDARVCPL